MNADGITTSRHRNKTQRHTALICKRPRDPGRRDGQVPSGQRFAPDASICRWSPASSGLRSLSAGLASSIILCLGGRVHTEGGTDAPPARRSVGSPAAENARFAAGGLSTVAGDSIAGVARRSLQATSFPSVPRLCVFASLRLCVFFRYGRICVYLRDLRAILRGCGKSIGFWHTSGYR